MKIFSSQIAFAQEPLHEETYFTSDSCGSYCCFPSDPLHIVASIPVAGYVPGQTVNLSLQVDNKGNQRIPHFSMQLVKVGDFDFDSECTFNALVYCSCILACYVLCRKRFNVPKVLSNVHNVVTWR